MDRAFCSSSSFLLQQSHKEETRNIHFPFVLTVAQNAAQTITYGYFYGGKSLFVSFFCVREIFC